MVTIRTGRAAAVGAALGGWMVLGAAIAAPQPDGRAIFQGKGNCWACHGREGRGTAMAPNLTDAEWLHGDGSVDSVAAVVRNGVSRPVRFGIMPARGGARLNDAEIRAVAEYVVSLSRGED